jgi:integrase
MTKTQRAPEEMLRSFVKATIASRDEAKPVGSTPLKGNNVSQAGGYYLRSLGISASIHQLRHWFETNLYARTQDLRMVQAMLGRSSPTTTAI